MNSTDRITAIVKLGKILKNYDTETFHVFENEVAELKKLVETSRQTNGWFIPENVSFALKAIGNSLEQFHVEKWFSRYPGNTFEGSKKIVVGVVMAGNIPLVGFHDYLCVMVTGNYFLGKLSFDDNKLLPLVHKILGKIEPGFSKNAKFTEGKLEHFDAIIATGSNNTARYFEYYFGKYPNIIRKNRNGVAVITGHETDEELAALGEDIFRYFGLGCRNVSKIYVPQKYEFRQFFEAIEKYGDVISHHKYRNNYDYNKSIFLVNKVEHLDNGFLLLTENNSIPSPVSVMHYEHFQNISDINLHLRSKADQIQCIVAAGDVIEGALSPGKSQKPDLWDYADNVDTVKFLMEIHNPQQ
jgi:hypothetical protein